MKAGHSSNSIEAYIFITQFLLRMSPYKKFKSIVCKFSILSMLLPPL